MSYFVRNVQLPQDYDSIANLLNIILSEDTNSEELAAEDAKIPTTGSLYLNEDGQLSGFDRHRIVAVSAQGKAAGYGISWRAPWTAAGELNQTLAVDPAYRGHGIGSMLYEQLEAWAVQNGASRLNIEVYDDDKHNIRFAERWGYQVERHTFESVLDLNLFETSRLSGWTARFISSLYQSLMPLYGKRSCMSCTKKHPMIFRDSVGISLTSMTGKSGRFSCRDQNQSICCWLAMEIN